MDDFVSHTQLPQLKQTPQIKLIHYSSQKKYRSLFQQMIDQDQIMNFFNYQFYTQEELKAIQKHILQAQNQSQSQQVNKLIIHYTDLPNIKVQQNHDNNQSQSQSFSLKSFQSIQSSSQNDNKVRKKILKRNRVRQRGRRGRTRRKYKGKQTKVQNNREIKQKLQNQFIFKVNVQDYWKLHIASKSLE